jgi:hypothetical protein
MFQLYWVIIRPSGEQIQCINIYSEFWDPKKLTIGGTVNLKVHVSETWLQSNKLTNQIQQFYKFITWRFVSLNMFRVPPRPSPGAYNCINSFWFYRWNVVVAALLVVVCPAGRPAGQTTTNNEYALAHTVKNWSVSLNIVGLHGWILPQLCCFIRFCWK